MMSYQPYSQPERRWRPWIYIIAIAVVGLAIWGGFRLLAPKEINEEIMIRPIEAPDTSFNVTANLATHNYICDTVAHIKYQKVDDGLGGYKKGKILQRNSEECGYYRYPARGTLAAGFLCDNESHTKHTRINDGKGGFIRGIILEQNSKDCGYTLPSTERRAVTIPPAETRSPVVEAPAKNPPAVRKTPDINPETPAKSTIVAPKSASKDPCISGTPMGKPYCGRGKNAGKLMQKKCNGKGGFYEDVIDPCTTECECGDISPREKPVPIIKN